MGLKKPHRQLGNKRKWLKPMGGMKVGIGEMGVQLKGTLYGVVRKDLCLNLYQPFLEKC